MFLRNHGRPSIYIENILIKAMLLKDKTILVTGGNGFLGSAVVDALIKHKVPKKKIKITNSKADDLRLWDNCEKVVKDINVVIHLAAKVGGIGLNKEKPGELFYDNILMGAQLMEASRKSGVEKFVSIGTVCAYPNITPIPFREEDLWNGYPEETNAPYGLAKKMLLVQGNAYRKQYDFNHIYLLPVNLYGPRDNFEPIRAHVMPALIRRVSEAKRNKKPFIEVWGTGTATREFLYIDDAAEGIILATEKYDKPDPVNLGSGMEISIRDLIKLICKVMNYKGEIKWDSSKPDGQPRRSLDTTRAQVEFAFKAKVKFEEGVRKAIDWYQKNYKE